MTTISGSRASAATTSCGSRDADPAYPLSMSLRASDRDPSADPGVDFYRFANGGWLDANPIPAGYGAWGAFEEVSRRNELTLRELLERAAAESRGALDGLLGDAFAAGMDVAAVEAAGLAAIAPQLRE